MELFYKYYSNTSEFALTNLNKQQISLSSIAVFNDPFEGIGSYTYNMDDKTKEFLQARNIPNLNGMGDHFVSDIHRCLQFKYRIFCCTPNHKNPLMWAHYANSHQGFCVGYEKSQLLQIAPWAKLEKIKYTNQLYPLNRIEQEQGENAIENESLIRDVLCYKSDVWEYEEEYRLCYHLKKDEQQLLTREAYKDFVAKESNFVSVLGNQIDPFRVSPLYVSKNCKAHSIYLGLNIDEATKSKLLNIANTQNLSVFQMSLSRDSFDLVSNSLKIKI